MERAEVGSSEWLDTFIVNLWWLTLTPPPSPQHIIIVVGSSIMTLIKPTSETGTQMMRFVYQLPLTLFSSDVHLFLPHISFSPVLPFSLHSQ